MQQLTSSSTIVRFGLFEADPARTTLQRNGVRVRIQDQPLKVLLILLERPGELVSREELKHRLWPEGTYVDFDGSLNVILKKLRAAIDDDSDNPRFIETVPRRGYRFIAPVSASARMSDSSALARGATTPTADSSSRAGEPTPQAFRRRVPGWLPAAAGCAVVLILLSPVALRNWPRSASGGTGAATVEPVPVPIRKSIAVLGFQNVSGRKENAWLAAAFAEMLSTELAGDGKLRLVPGEDVANLRLSSRWPQMDTLDAKTASRIGTALNGDLLLLGSYTVLNPAEKQSLRVDVRLQDASTGQILAEFSELGSSQELFQVVARIGDRLRGRLGILPMEERDAASILSALPLDPEAARFYALGVASLQHFDALGAKDLLQQAVRVDPKFSLAHAMLARAWNQLGYQQNRAAEAKRAMELSTDLPQAERLIVQGEYYESIGQHDKAASIFRALFGLYPDNVEYGLRLASADKEAGNGSQALETLGRLRRLPPPASDDPRIDLAEAGIVNGKPRDLALIRSAVSKASQQGKKILYAQARRDECMTLIYSEHPELAPTACNEAYKIFLAAGNRAAAADAVRLIADQDGTMGHLEEALATYQRALTLVDGLGEDEKTGAILNNMAIVLTNEGKLDRAEESYRRAKKHFELAGNVGNTATALGNLADIAYLRGDLARAEKLYQQALQIQMRLDPSRPGYMLYRLADLELNEGKVREAELHAQQATAALQKEQGSYQYLTTAMDELGEVVEARGDLAQARDLFEQSLALRLKTAEQGMVAESHVELAEINLEQGKPDGAEPLLRSATAEFDREHSDPDSSAAYTLLSRALLAQGRFDDARAAARRGSALSLTSQDPVLRLSAVIQGARVDAAFASKDGQKKQLPAAMQELNAASAEAQRKGYVTLSYEARLALGELELKHNMPAGRAHLQTLAVDARGRGLSLLAEQAERVLGSAGNVVAARTTNH